jgi:hypothetical protein
MGGAQIEGGCASASFKRAKAMMVSEGEDTIDVWLLDIGCNKVDKLAQELGRG